jgi:hypothetical protein
MLNKKYYENEKRKLSTTTKSIETTLIYQLALDVFH